MSKETYKSLRLSQAEAKLLAETYGIVDSKGNPLAEWFTNPKRNLPKAAIQGFRQLRSDLNKNAQAVLNIIPEGFTAGGKATGVPNNLKKLLYKKVNNRWELRKDLSIKDIQPNILIIGSKNIINFSRTSIGFFEMCGFSVKK